MCPASVDAGRDYTKKYTHNPPRAPIDKGYGRARLRGMRARTHEGHSLAPLARGLPCGSNIPTTRRDQHHQDNQPTQAGAEVTRSLRSLVCSPAAPTFPPQDANNTKRGGHSLAPLARGLACGSPFPPAPALAPLAWASCFLRAGETPALRQQGKRKGCAIANPPP